MDPSTDRVPDSVHLRFWAKAGWCRTWRSIWRLSRRLVVHLSPPTEPGRQSIFRTPGGAYQQHARCDLAGIAIGVDGSTRDESKCSRPTSDGTVPGDKIQLAFEHIEKIFHFCVVMRARVEPGNDGQFEDRATFGMFTSDQMIYAASENGYAAGLTMLQNNPGDGHTESPRLRSIVPGRGHTSAFSSA